MHLLADEDIYFKTIKFLETSGYKVEDVYKHNLTSTPDIEILSYATKNNFVVLTQDKGFSLLHQMMKYSGIILTKRRLQIVRRSSLKLG